MANLSYVLLTSASNKTKNKIRNKEITSNKLNSEFIKKNTFTFLKSNNTVKTKTIKNKKLKPKQSDMEAQMPQEEAKGQDASSRKVKRGHTVRLSFSNHD